jgi:hypothetical protein
MGWLFFALLHFISSTFPIPLVVNGFHEHVLAENSTLSVNLTSQKMIFFSFPCTEQILVEYLKHSNLHTHSGICGKGPVVVPWELIRFTSFQRIATARFWIIPRAFCPSSTLLMTAENQLDASAENEIQEFPVCVFTQPEAAHFQMAIATGPNSSSAIRYYSASMRSAQYCQDPRRCEFRSFQPFFGLISGIAPEGNFSMRISYRVQARANRDFRCTMRSLPRIT